MPHVGDHRTVEVCGTDFLAAHRLEKGPTMGGQRERARGPGRPERGPRGVREAGRAGLRSLELGQRVERARTSRLPRTRTLSTPRSSQTGRIELEPA